MVAAARSRPWVRVVSALGLAVVCFALGGCVYLRLLAFKRQLADFDRHFTLKTDEGLRLVCHAPLLLAEDFRWLGVTPQRIDKIGAAEQWHIRWAKQFPPGAKPTSDEDLEMELIFAAGMFTRLFLPERYFAFVPKPFFAGLLRSLGKAGVDRSRRLAEVNFTPAERAALLSRVSATSLAMLLGIPTEQIVDGPRQTLRYRYMPVPPESKNGVIDMTFTFGTTTGQLLRLQGRSPVGQLSFNFESAPVTPVAP